MPSTEVQTAQTMMICKYDIIIRQHCVSAAECSPSFEVLEFSGKSLLLPPVWSIADGATDLDDGEHADVDGHVAHLVLLASTEEQVGDDEEVLVQLVNLIGNCPVKVVFLQQNDDENDTMLGYDWNTPHIDFNVSTWSFSASWVTVRFFPSHPLARQLTCLNWSSKRKL